MHQQVVNKSWINHEKVVYKTGASHDTPLNKLKTSGQQVVNKWLQVRGRLKTRYVWTNHGQVVNTLMKSCEKL